MLSNSRLRRRWLGGISLVFALVLLILGETVLKGRLTPEAFLVYWLICLVLTITAIIVAFLDFRDLGRSTVHQHRDLIDKTLEEIETEARRRKGDNGQSERR
jgi:hypothetical protein